LYSGKGEKYCFLMGSWGKIGRVVIKGGQEQTGRRGKLVFAT